MKTPNPWLVILNDFCHDLFTGLWCGGFVTLLLIRSRAEGLGAEAQAFAGSLAGAMTALVLASLAAIVATGVFRFFYYRDWDGRTDPSVKKRLLIIKHAVLGSSFLAGTALVAWWGLR